MVNLNILISICTIIPFCTLLLFTKDKSRTLFLFLIIGMLTCLFSGEINGFIINIFNINHEYAVINITPIVEETLKLFPIVIYVLIYLPNEQMQMECAISLGLGFAILENIFYLSSAHNISLLFALTRGFCSAPLHCFCTLIAGYSISFYNKNKELFLTSSISLLAMTINIHAIYNLLIQSHHLILGAFIPIILFISFYFLLLNTKIFKLK